MSSPIAPTPITADRAEGWLRRLFAFKGRALAGIQDRVQLGLDAVQDKYFDQLAPSGVMPFFTRDSLPALAANVGTYALWNPPGSGLVAVIERARVEINGAVAFAPQFQYARCASNPGGGVSQIGVFCSDLRTQDDTTNLTTRTGLFLFSQNTAAGFASWATFAGGAAMYTPAIQPLVAGGQRYVVDYPDQVVVGPGSAFGAFFNAGAANLATTAFFSGYVRAALAGELTKTFGY